MLVINTPEILVRHGHTGEIRRSEFECRKANESEYSIHSTPVDIQYEGVDSAEIVDWAISLRQPQDIPVFGDTDRLVPNHAIRISFSGDEFLHEGNILVLYQYKEWWMRPTWTEQWSRIPDLSQMLIWKNGSTWKVLVANVNNGVRADFAPTFRVDAEHLGVDCVLSYNREHVKESACICAYAQGADVHQCIKQCTNSLAQADRIQTRDERMFPDALRGLGWCTWDSLGKDVDEAAILAKMDELQGKEVPVSWILIDDGWSSVDRETEQLMSFREDKSRFPHGLKHTVDVLERVYGVQHVGVWQCFHGYWNGISEAADPEVLAHTETTSVGIRVPAHNESDAFAWWNEWHRYLAEQGIDFVKVDSQGSISLLDHGIHSFEESARERHAALDKSVALNFDNALINCMGMTPENIWSRPNSPIVRSSNDYLPRDYSWLCEHMLENAYTSLLTNNLYINDWDMFWTDHPHAWTHAISRLISGGPVYFSDAVGKTDPEILHMMCDDSGNVWTPDVPAHLSEQCLLHPDRALVLVTEGYFPYIGECRIYAVFGLSTDEEQCVVIGEIGSGDIFEWKLDEPGKVNTVKVGEDSVKVLVNSGQVRVFFMMSR